MSLGVAAAGLEGVQIRTPAVVPELLEEYGEVTRKALLEFLPKREPTRYLYDLIAEYPRRSGRMMRPAICIATARAYGASIDSAIHCAVSVELLHNALLVIDDIQDGSETRRGGPCLHRSHGTPVAINVGSTMSILSLVPLLNNLWATGPGVSLSIFEQAIKMAQSSAEGQALELGWRLDNRMDLDEEDYLDMVLKKTCAYSTIYPLSSGALLATGDHALSDSLVRYGFFLGASFQIQDDVLNIAGDEVSYGKELAGDIWEGKRTLLTIDLMHKCTPDQAARVTGIYGKDREDKNADEVRWVLDLMHHYNCVESTRAYGQAIAGAALEQCRRHTHRLPASRDREFLEGLPYWTIEQI